MILKNQDDPLYMQLCQQLCQAIINGDMHSGEKLDSERSIAAQYGVSRTTARLAIKCLQEMGMVTIIPQKGTFVV